jgi:hypothetical protein
MSSISDHYRTTFFPDAQQSPMHVSINGIGKSSTETFVQLEIPLAHEDGSTVPVQGSFHVIPDLGCGMIIGNDILHANQAVIDFPNQTLYIRNKPIPISTTCTPHPRQSLKKRAIYAMAAQTVLPGHGFPLPIRFRDQDSPQVWQVIPVPQISVEHDSFGSIPSALISRDNPTLPYANMGRSPIHIRTGQLLGYVSVPQQISQLHGTVQLIGTDDHTNKPLGANDHTNNLPIGTDHHTDNMEAHTENIPLTTAIDPPTEIFSVDDADISLAWGSEFHTQIRQLLTKHATLFRPQLGMFNDGIQMPIQFTDESDLKGLKQAPYQLSRRDKDAMDSVLDPLARQGRIEKVPLGARCAASSPAFIVWNKNKPRVVVDLRRVNQKLFPNAYPLPRQDDVLQALGGATIFSSLDITKGFFQQPIRSDDRWKTAFTTPHRGLEQLTVSTMGLASSPGFFQHRMENLLAEYLWDFVLVYIDDIIIFSRTKEHHVSHLDQALTLLAGSGITLAPQKCHFAYPSVQLLGHHVSRLGISTAADKVAAVRNMVFPTNLRQLEAGIQFLSYYRKFVYQFSALAEPLHILKTLRFKMAPYKGAARLRFAERTPVADNTTAAVQLPVTEPTTPVAVPYASDDLIARAKEAWQLIRDRIISAPILIYPDFSKTFYLYVDGSKEWGYGVAVHQMGSDNQEHPVLFLSKALNKAERNYWATELECGALV